MPAGLDGRPEFLTRADIGSGWYGWLAGGRELGFGRAIGFAELWLAKQRLAELGLAEPIAGRGGGSRASG